MVVLKRIYEPSKYHDDMAYADVVSYILNPEKTCLQLIGGFAVNPKYAAREMLALTKAAGKDFEVRLHHFVVSFGRSDVSNPYLAHQIGTRIADFFADDYQLLFAVHTNRPNIHIHFVMNAVSYQTGKNTPGAEKIFIRSQIMSTECFEFLKSNRLFEQTTVSILDENTNNKQKLQQITVYRVCCSSPHFIMRTSSCTFPPAPGSGM